MGKISGTNYQPPVEDDEPREDAPAFVPEEGEESDVPVVTEEGEELKPETTPETEKGEGEGEPEKPKFTFASEEELDKFIASRKPAAPVAPTTETPAPAKTDEKDPLEDLVFWKGQFDEEGKWVGEKPKDWNDLAKTVIRYLTSEDQKKAVVDYIRNMTETQKKEMEKIDQEFDHEFDELAAQGLVPKRGTKEGDEVNAKISTIGGTYGLPSMKQAYELAKKIPASEGGLLDYKPTAAPKVNPSKQASRFIKSSTQTQSASKGKSVIPYAKLHNARSVDELIDE